MEGGQLNRRPAWFKQQQGEVLMKDSEYVHGYSARENSRLVDQANALTQLLHGDTFYHPGSRVLEAGCGVGAQTLILAKNSPEAEITSIDISQDSVCEARALIGNEGISNVSFQVADLFHLPFEDASFDHVFVCFVLEHLPDPLGALQSLKLKLKPGGSITVIEGDHGSTYFYPESAHAARNVQCLVEIQARLQGNSLIGRQVYPLLKQTGFNDVVVSPRMVYVDSSKPELVEGFTKNTFIAMVEGVKEQAVSLGLIDETAWNRGIEDLYRTTHDDGTFCYTFFKGVALR
jgi:ubiquinone/menaquinone biosynthesis C-methylase UbiE